MDGFRTTVKAAYDKEMARAKAGDCPDADNTRDIVDCLGKEIETTTANYKAYTGALRSLLGIMDAGELVKEFDVTEAAWQKYREAQRTAAYGQFKGGTAAGPNASACDLMLIRNHLREIENVYYMRLHG